MTLLHLAAAGAAATAVSAALVPLIYRWAVRRRIVAVPNERSSHVQVTPVGGGLPIVLCVTAGILLWRTGIDAASDDWWLYFAGGGLLVAAVSWWDDMRGVAVGVRLAVHAVAAAMVLLPLGEAGASPTVMAAALVWIVGFSNAYNFMDGIDGIAASQAIAAGLGWVWLGSILGIPMVAVVGALVAGASLGFLFYNWHPARIFMGDVGAAFLGFTFASFTVLAFSRDADAGLAGVLFVWPFVFDTAFTLLRRIARGENILRAHRSHLYQRLVAAGWSHAHVTMLYAALAVVGVAVGISIVT